jgi:four helix bundle protein
MFDFQKLDVYQKTKVFLKGITEFLKSHPQDKAINDQLKRAALSIMLNIAEGTSRFSNKDRKNFMVIARGSAFECAAILEFLSENADMDKTSYDAFNAQLEEISKMLFALIKKLDN